MIFEVKTDRGFSISTTPQQIATINILEKNHNSITSNATDYEIPDDATFIYFFNSFGMEVMKKVVERITNSVDRHPRKITIIHVV